MTVIQELIACILPGCVSTNTDEGLETMYTSNAPKGLSDYRTLHIRKSGILDLEQIESNLNYKQFKMIQTETEWILFKPKNTP